MNCSNCGICYESRENRAIVGFPAHSTKKKKSSTFDDKGNDMKKPFFMDWLNSAKGHTQAEFGRLEEWACKVR